MNQSSWASLAEVPVTDVLQDSSEGLQILDKTLSKQAAHTMVRPCPNKKTRKSKPPARIKPWWPVWCAIFGRQTVGSIPGDAQAEFQAIRSFVLSQAVPSF